MTKYTDSLKKQISNLDEEAFGEIAEHVAEAAAPVEDEPADEFVHIRDLKEELANARKYRGKLRGLSTGFSKLDALFIGLEKGSVVLIGGDTSQGKSALATNIAMNLARAKQKVDKESGELLPQLETGHGVLYISLEMTKEQMLDRMDQVTEGKLDPDHYNILFQQEFSLGYKDLEPLIKNARKSQEVSLVVLDYLQYLGRGMGTEETARMSKELKRLALKYQVCFLVIVSLRKGEGGRYKRNALKDVEIEELMGTAAIGYDADIAMITSRKDEEDEWQDDKIYVKLLKNRTNKYNFRERIVELDWHDTRIYEQMKTARAKKH